MSRDEKQKAKMGKEKSKAVRLALRLFSFSITEKPRISSTLSVASHQIAERYMLMRDDIQPKGLMISTTLRAAMICQVCDLDKKILQKIYPFLQYFLVETTGLEPVTPCMSSKYSDQLSYASVSGYIYDTINVSFCQGFFYLTRFLRRDIMKKR